MVNLRRLRDALDDQKDVCEVVDPKSAEGVAVLFEAFVEQGRFLSQLENPEVTKSITHDDYKQYRDQVEGNIIDIGKCLSQSQMIDIKGLRKVTQAIIDKKIIITGDEKDVAKIFKKVDRDQPKQHTNLNSISKRPPRRKKTVDLGNEGLEIDELDIKIPEDVNEDE